MYTGTQLSEIRDVPAPVCDREQVVVDCVCAGHLFVYLSV